MNCSSNSLGVPGQIAHFFKPAATPLQGMGGVYLDRVIGPSGDRKTEAANWALHSIEFSEKGGSRVVKRYHTPGVSHLMRKYSLDGANIPEQ
jgi:hypothetical protein